MSAARPAVVGEHNVVVEPFLMPRNLADAIRVDGDERRRLWVGSLPAVVARLERAWSVTVGAPFQPGGQTAWVAPARTVNGDAVVLKVAWRHPEADHEPEGLHVWDGDGAVRLYASDHFDDTIALLVERCVPGTPLTSRAEADQDTVIASLLHRLWRDPPSGHRFRPLQQMCDAWADAFEQKTATRPVDLDPGLARAGIALFRTLPATAERRVLLCTDLHAGNVLAATRDPWMMIDPQPYVGDPHYDVTQHLLNCDQRLHADPHGLARRMADLAGLDPDRVRLWLFARCVQESIDWPAPLTDIARRIAPT